MRKHSAQPWHQDITRAIYGYVKSKELNLDDVGRAMDEVFDYYRENEEDGDCMVEFIGLIYFGGATVQQAADAVYIGERKARYWKNNFDYMVGEKLGFK